MHTVVQEFVNDLAQRRQPLSSGGMAHTLLELYGASMVEVTAFEPDPASFAHNYYYNALTNRLYRRVVTDDRSSDGVCKAQWVPTGG